MIKEKSKNQFQVCCICGRKFKGYGNNAYPICEGVCCDNCNYEVVIPARLKR